MNEGTGNKPEPRSLARELLWFFLRFLGASVALYALYLVAGKVYARFIALLATPLLALFGYELLMEKALAVTEDISLNPVVFLSLVIAVRHIAWRVKLRAAVIGAVILTVANALTLCFVFVSYYRGSELLWTGSEFWGLTIDFFLPIGLWFMLLPIKQAFPFFTFKRS